MIIKGSYNQIKTVTLVKEEFVFMKVYQKVGYKKFRNTYLQYPNTEVLLSFCYISIEVCPWARGRQSVATFWPP